MFNRENIIKFIPKPSNQDVIIYDIELKDLIDVNVPVEYKNKYKIFEDKRNKYLLLKDEIQKYKKYINNVYLLHPSWKEEEYLQELNKLKKTYSILFEDIRKKETKIEVLNKKIQGINDKIDILKIKDSKKIDDKIIIINENIEKNKEKISNLKLNLSSSKDLLNNLEEKINENSDTFDLLSQMVNQLNEKDFKCPLCNSKVKNHSEESLLYKRILRKLENNKEELNKLLKEKENCETNIKYYNDELLKIKAELNNEISFKENSNLLYNKKSIPILELEAEKDSSLEEITKLKDEISNSRSINSNEYIKLKDTINRCEISLNNLKRIKEYKQDIKDKIQEFNKLEEELKVELKIINHYIKFLSIYYKIYEKKANEFCGSNFKFKFHKIEEYKLIEIFELKYKNIDYLQLNLKEKEDVDKYLLKKFPIYN